MSQPPDPHDEAALRAFALLADPVRARVYRYVATHGGPVSRDDAGAALELPRHTVKFHLEKLHQAGLLDAEYRRLHGRSGPGAGRPSKLYRRAPREFTLAVPERHYELAGSILAAALQDAAVAAAPADVALEHAACDAGRQLGRNADDAKPGIDGALAVLGEHGFEPRRHDRSITLENCPFRSLARENPNVVCAMNLGLVMGLLEALDVPNDARLDPADARCCVVIET